MLWIFLIGSNVIAQSETEDNQVHKIADKASLGLGLGQEYGGIGGSFLVYPQENIGFFAGAGYAVADLGYNIGTKVRFFSKTNPRTTFYLVGMYGYNAAIKVSGGSQFNKMYYGPTFGLGIDTGKRSYRKGYWTVSLLFPIRSSEVDDYIDDLENNYGVEFEGNLWPITFSIGYRFSLS